MTFRDWVTKCGGAGAVARKLGVSKETVLFWLKRRGNPKTLTIAKMIKLSDGALTFNEIVNGTSKKAVL